MVVLRYKGDSHERILSSADLAALGVEDHPGLVWNADNSGLVEVSEEVAEVLLVALRTELVKMVEEEPALPDGGSPEPKTKKEKAEADAALAKAEAEAAQKP